MAAGFISKVGRDWNERVVGINSIGTALWTGEPVFVHAAEHFCDGIKRWSCAGVPIRDLFDNRVVGVVDLSGLIDIFRPHNTALVALAAREVEGVMARRQSEERTRLLEAFLASRLNNGHEDGVILLDRVGRVVFSRQAPERAQIDGVERELALGMRLLDLSERMSESELVAAVPEGCGRATSAACGSTASCPAPPWWTRSTGRLGLNGGIGSIALKPGRSRIVARQTRSRSSPRADHICRTRARSCGEACR